MASYIPNVTNYTKRALLIGHDQYKTKTHVLRHCKNDADDLGRLLDEIGFLITMYRDLTNEKMRDAFLEFRNTIKNGDLVVVYFSGHGYQVDGENYMMPVDDTKVKKKEDVESFGFQVSSELSKLTRDKPLGVTIFILDCCRTYWIDEDGLSRGGCQRKGLTRMNPPTGTFIMFACDADQTASDGAEDVRNGLFTKHLMNHIRTCDKDIVLIAQAVAADVLTESNRTQRPIHMNGLIGAGHVYLHNVSIDNIMIPNSSTIARWSQNGATVAGGNGRGDATDQLNDPGGLFVVDDQTIVIADSENHRIMQWKKGDKNGQVVAGGNGQGNRLDQLNKPTDVLIDKETDSLIICDYANRRVVRWSRRSGTIKGESLIDHISCWGLAMDDQGNLYVSDTRKNGVRRYRRNDKKGTFIAGGNREGAHFNQFSMPTYIFVDRQQNVYVSDRGNHRVMKWNKDAKEGVLVAGGQGIGHALTQLYHCGGLFVDTSGTLYVADEQNNRVLRWPQGMKEGTVVVGEHGWGSAANQLCTLRGLSFDRHGNLYVAEYHNSRVQCFLIE